nr:hypothetical protein [Streptomyces katrae]
MSITVASKVLPTRSMRTAASTRSTDRRSGALPFAFVIVFGRSSRAARTQSGGAWPSQAATHSSPAYRSTRRRSGAVQCVYGAAIAAWLV